MGRLGGLDLNSINSLTFNIDQHSTATDGRYELKEALLQEFRSGTFNWKYEKHFPPILNNLANLNLKFRDSKKTTLIRSADIVANYVFNMSRKNKVNEIRENIKIVHFP